MLVGTDIQKGCSSYSRQTDPGNGKTLDMCMDNRRDCPFYEGIYITRGDTQPTGGVSRYDCGIAEGVAVGFCRLQKDAIRLGPILLFLRG